MMSIQPRYIYYIYIYILQPEYLYMYIYMYLYLYLYVVINYFCLSLVYISGNFTCVYFRIWPFLQVYFLENCFSHCLFPEFASGIYLFQKRISGICISLVYISGNFLGVYFLIGPFLQVYFLEIFFLCLFLEFASGIYLLQKRISGKCRFWMCFFHLVELSELSLACISGIYLSGINIPEKMAWTWNLSNYRPLLKNPEKMFL